ncbi:MAG: acetyl-CoA carboxylase biotin carboxylase subunit, partial [Caldilineaceae bacterium]|nr:acetyl-CoA carboxylase biotin carboxylase subunit [Caldilineaceae bacterium]
DSTEFIWGTFDTGFINRRSATRNPAVSEEYEQIVAVVAALVAHEEGRQAVHIRQNSNGTSAQRRNSAWKEAGRIRSVGGRW